MPTIITPIPVVPTQVITNSPLSFNVNGAIISEALDSDAGNLIALDRKEIAKRYIVRCPFLDDKPTKYLPVLFPQGKVYPGTQAEYKGMVVYGYDEGERIGVQEWHSAVIYRSADELATLGWVGEGEFSDEQEHIRRDESDVFATDGDGNFLLDDAGNKIRTGNFIGHWVFVPVDDPTAAYEAASSLGSTIKLKRTGAFKVVGYDRYKRVHRFSMTRVLAALPWRTVKNVGDLVWTVNSKEFLTYQPGTLAFTNFGWRETFGAIPSAPATAKQYEVRLQFAGNPDKWSPIRIGATFTDENNFESEVHPIGNPESPFRDFRIYKLTAFSTIFQLLNVGAPGK
jgi:hypothetical protein